ncbi:MAG: PEP-CTERM sorting domain-containing protein [Planctomycetaceae bacterium]|nr:PEP-CTERM sorting domain-containing protein [Planctomycetaceae bacterium]
MLRTFIVIALVIITAPPARATTVADLEDLTLAPESFYNGADLAGGFVSHGAHFGNTFDATFGSWYGFAYSNQTDNTTSGFLNQYSSFAGTDVSGGGNYAVGFDPTAGFYGAAPLVTLPAGQIPIGAYLTNATYPAISMRDGDPFAKKFGGTTGDDPDWLLLTITGKRADDTVAGIVDFYLADFRSADNSLDYIVDQWTWVDLSSIGQATTLQFTLSSTDNGQFGMNTPAYFTIDSVTSVPAPAAGVAGPGLLTLAAARRRRR